ncbi:hypothetical protein PG999_007667 [Apiospora kogelbergensis]|uniref:Phosphoribosyltransferase domain-containing protein n=1 Tax=Apiospora kogelbergensis TaxID=1337665 RepID=A0AAW0QM59_9PEZI
MDNFSDQIHTLSPPPTATVIGLYGIPGSGKTFLLKQLREQHEFDYFKLYEGCNVIGSLVPGGLDAFKKAEEHDKTLWRKHAIDSIKNECNFSERTAVVTGHFMFWPEGGQQQPVHTPNDFNTYSHILYLDVPAELIAQRRTNDTQRTRPSASVGHLRAWRDAEKTQLRMLCRQHGILFYLVSLQDIVSGQVPTLLHNFQHHSEESNTSHAILRLDEAMSTQKYPQTVLVLDADKTLATVDTGELFWSACKDEHDECPLKKLFGGPLGYSYTAFRQAMLLYEEAADEGRFDDLCDAVASKVQIHPEFVFLLRLVATHDHVGAVVVTCGLGRVWTKVLAKHGLSKAVQVIGGGRVEDGFVVTAAVKASLVSHLRVTHRAYVWAFGDSSLDIPMMCEADRAVVVVGPSLGRSRTMDDALSTAIDKGGLRAHQVLLPGDVPPRLDVAKLPLLQLHDPDFLQAVFDLPIESPDVVILHATEKNAAKLLMTPMRDARIRGTALRKAHASVGKYLTLEYLSEWIGVEKTAIPHVQGQQTPGFRMYGDEHISIVALMRGGEPLAQGVAEVLENAMFLHAQDPQDVKTHHLAGQSTVLLVDSVVNSGRTVLQFVEHIRELHATIPIVVVAGVVQAQSLQEGGLLYALGADDDFGIVALRLSDNNYTGSGGTDTGNRLFNTTHMP